MNYSCHDQGFDPRELIFDPDHAHVFYCILRLGLLGYSLTVRGTGELTKSRGTIYLLREKQTQLDVLLLIYTES